MIHWIEGCLDVESLWNRDIETPTIPTSGDKTEMEFTLREGDSHLSLLSTHWPSF